MTSYIALELGLRYLAMPRPDDCALRTFWSSWELENYIVQSLLYSLIECEVGIIQCRRIL